MTRAKRQLKGARWTLDELTRLAEIVAAAEEPGPVNWFGVARDLNGKTGTRSDQACKQKSRTVRAVIRGVVGRLAAISASHREKDRR